MAYRLERDESVISGIKRVIREEIEKRLRQAIATGQVPETVKAHGLATVIIAMLRGVALQSLIDDHVDLAAARFEIEQLAHSITLTRRIADPAP